MNRENYKVMLNCTDEQLDKLLEIMNDAHLLGIAIDFDEFVNRIAVINKLSLMGESIDDPVGILKTNKQ